MTDRAATRLLHLVGFHDPTSEPVRRAEDDEAEWRDESARRFLKRLPPWLDFSGKTVLDVGCGGGSMCLHLARSGAAKAVGVDIQSVAGAEARLEREPELAARCEFRQIDSLSDLGDRRFDAVISQDSFEHYADPERFVFELIEPLVPGGLLVIGFGPLWKAPLGGHIGYMTSIPWAHLLFPERVIMAERRRFRPEEDPARYEEIRGGLNKMTFARFRRIMASTGLEQVSLETNRGDHPAVKAFRLLRALRPLREYFTSNVYGVWRKATG
jgi:SAM-dependent methyltransferase